MNLDLGEALLNIVQPNKQTLHLLNCFNFKAQKEGSNLKRDWVVITIQVLHQNPKTIKINYSDLVGFSVLY